MMGLCPLLHDLLCQIKGFPIYDLQFRDDL